MSKKDTPSEEPIQNIENALSKAEHFIETNRKSITIIIAGIVLATGLYMGFTHLYLKPQSEEAMAQMFSAEKFFENEEYDKALNGEGSSLGFLAIIDQYSITPSANLANYYAGICYLRTGEFEKAISYLESYDAKDKIISNIALGAMGDAYAELGKNKEALSYYIKASEYVKNDFTSPIYLMRAGILYEQENQLQKALDIYNQIKKEYPQSTEGVQIDKYISRVETSLLN